MTSRRRLTAALVPALLAGVLGLAGCTASSGSTGPGDPTTAPPGVPVKAEAYSMAGAKAFAKAWVQALNKATTSGNTKTLRTLSGPNCAPCQDFASSLDKIYSAGGHVETEGWQKMSVIPIQGMKNLQHPAFQVTVTAAPQKLYASKSAKVKTYKGGHQGMRMFLKRTHNHWLVQNIEIAQGS